ncbi:uncharacterized protein BJ212DRAFT_695444 [Suillus subaureus]|uniref:F-box domain-containing protein n=1 Tax=Suillus subaureus TaxID=48587 RepID=A0A9P7EKY5_9AGAM|nr:uncharacterized protein BJ212DRAFT_695444 [Suillus subaureus]KAG1823645.1 hypothetical protein BJ212DRAFT_695444 [Suillus subaureus]
MEAESAECQRAHNSSSVASFLSASTRCIMIAELRWKIFDLVAPPNMPVSTVRRLPEFEWGMDSKLTFMRQSLLTLALTCKSFTGPALDLLWRHLGGLEPLIKCLPRSLWKQDEKKLEFQRTMTLGDWSIFCKYNYRVHSLVNQCQGSFMNDEMICGTEIWHALTCPPFSLPLLPNLTSLTWTQTSGETFQYIRLFITPQLTMLNIHARSFTFKTFDPSEHPILSSIPKSCPSVSDFSLVIGSGRSIQPRDTSTILQCWSHLTSVRTGTVSEAGILHLSSLPSLQVLKFQLPPTPISAATRKLLQQPVFCALQELDITCKRLVILEAFLEQLTVAPKLLSFTITHGVDSARALPASISRIANGCAHSSLQQVQFNITNQPIDRDALIEAEAFRPLFAFHNLRKLDFKADEHCIVQMDDAALLEMGKAWPLLEELYITRYCHSSHQVTPDAFVSLLQHCPRLVSIAVTVDWSTIDAYAIPPGVPSQGFFHKTLSRAFFGGSRIDHPINIAVFISAIAPNVNTIEAWDPEIHGDDDYLAYSPAWNLVVDLIKTFPFVRNQGKMMMLNELMKMHEIRMATARPRSRETENEEVAVGGDIDEGGEAFEEDSGSEGHSVHMH